jgi:hypothetical protein
MSIEAEEGKNVSLPQTQMPLSETNTTQLSRQSANSGTQVDFINALTVLVTATIGGGQILTASGRFGLLGSITGLILLGILLIYGNTTYTWKQSLVYSAAVGLSVLQIFGFLFNDLFNGPGIFFQMNLGDFFSFGFWLIVTIITYFVKINMIQKLKNIASVGS